MNESCVRFLRVLLDSTKDVLTKDLSNTSIKVDSGSDYELGEKLGSGISASVYEVLKKDRLNVEDEIVVKISHQWRTTARNIPFSNKQISREINTYPLKSEYNINVAPTIAIEKINGTDFLIKEKIIAQPLRLLLKKTQAKDLPKEIMVQLNDLYQTQLKVFKEKTFGWI